MRKPALEVTWEDYNLVLETNLRGSFFVAQEMARRMIGHGYGRIINIGSVTSVMGYAGLGPYTASRGGIRQLTMSLADDWGRHGITVNCLAPGWFQTAQNRVMYENAEWVEYLRDRIPLKRPGAPDDLDGAIVFLASESSRYMTGQTSVDRWGDFDRGNAGDGAKGIGGGMGFRRFAVVVLMAFGLASVCVAQGKLRVFFVDVEGGQATLFVTPAGESLLIDTGWPGEWWAAMRIGS